MVEMRHVSRGRGSDAARRGKLMQRLGQRVQVVRAMGCVGHQRLGQNSLEISAQGRHDLARAAHAWPHSSAGDQLVKDGANPENARACTAGAGLGLGRQTSFVARQQRRQLRVRWRDLKEAVLVFDQHRRMKEHFVAGAMQVGQLHAQRHDDSDRLLEVQLRPPRPQLFEAGAEGTGSDRGTDREGRDQMLSARHYRRADASAPVERFLARPDMRVDGKLQRRLAFAQRAGPRVPPRRQAVP